MGGRVCLARTAVVVATTILSLSACVSGSNDIRIIERAPSPDQKRDAILAQGLGGGATVPDTQDVYVVARGHAPTLADRVFTSDHVCHLKAKWLSNDDIEISYWAKKAEMDRSAAPPASIRVVYRWLGRDVASGC